jgi:hypothetical protein
MTRGQVFRDCHQRFIGHLVILLLTIAIIGFPFFAGFSQNAPHHSPQDSAQPIYSDSSDDSWNRAFYCLFTRRVETRLSAEYPEGAPFAEYRQGSPMRVSTRTFERLEIGDRAIDPLYPNFFVTTGAKVVLTERKYSEFAKALQDALNDNTPRSTVARAVMQSDLWSAYDQLYGEFTGPDQREIEQRRRVLADLLGHLIKKVALTPQEIHSLPSNYSAAMHQQALPDIFNKSSGWIEILWFPRRQHEEAASDRRVARVFLKPTHPSRGLQKIVDDQRQSNGDSVPDLDGVALVMQLLLIDTQGNLTPTTLTTDVQVRLFERTAAGDFKGAKVQMAEISRRLFISDPASGGLAAEAEDSPAYLPGAGNDYTFASPQLAVQGPPIQVRLRTRCAYCHEQDLTQVMTFSIAMPPRFLTPPVRQLDPAANQEADYVASRKKGRRDFKVLRAYFDKS